MSTLTVLLYVAAAAVVPVAAAAGIVKGLVEVVKTAQKEKVVRVGLLSLRNLLADGDAIMASDMVDAGLAKVVASRAMQVGNGCVCRCVGA
jgi:hypothetical protein